MRQVGDEPDRIDLGGLAGGREVEVVVLVPAGIADRPRERRLAALPRPVHEHDRRIPQRLDQAPAREAWIHAIDHRLIVTFQLG